MSVFHSLRGQVALVTGAGSADGIGFAIARALAEDGAAVVLSSTTERIDERVAELVAEGHAATGVVADLMQAGSSERVVATALEVAGRLDICVNNAGMIAVGMDGTAADLEAVTDPQWHDGIQRNLTTCFAVTRAAVTSMRHHRYGRIVNIASTSGPVQVFHGDVAYQAAKAGMLGFTRAVALETAGFGITCNAVAPGWIATGSQLPGEQVAGSLTPMGRSGTPLEIASAVRYLADRSASYITGQLLVVDGGNSLPEDRSWRP
jgi:3-oxoacyl-[acyl-carrier protein] reductase